MGTSNVFLDKTQNGHMPTWMEKSLEHYSDALCSTLHMEIGPSLSVPNCIIHCVLMSHSRGSS